jgi:pseudaminic acid cytidylyltransferase
MNLSIAVIPARGGSKRIPRKNIRDFSGLPAISYALVAARESQLFSEIIVTTDDEEIKSISQEFGATIVVKRPDNLADDITPTVPVVAHAVESFIQSHNVNPSGVCCIYPINPFLQASDLKSGLEILRENPQVSYVNAVCSYPYPIQRAVTVKDGWIKMMNPQNALTRSQDLDETYHDAGQWYWGKSDTWLRHDKLLFNSKAFVVPRWRCQDIDTEEDWKYAELLFKASKK